MQRAGRGSRHGGPPPPPWHSRPMAPPRFSSPFVRTLAARMVAGGFTWLSRLGRLHPHARPAHHGITLERNLQYGATAESHHMLDLYRLNEAAAPRPVVLYLHGGGFRACSKDTHWIFGLAFARMGAVVVHANYRLAPRHPYPAAVEDACAALLWTHTNAGRFGGDPERIFVAGESAGGNLAAVLALATSWRRAEPYARALFDAGIRLRGVVAAYGAMQVTEPERLLQWRPHLPWLVQQVLFALPENYLPRTPDPALSYDLANPLTTLENAAPPERPLPPFFLPVGTADPLLPDTRSFAAAARKHGANAVDRYYPRELHGFHGLIWRRQARECWTEIRRFVEEHGRERQATG